MMSVKHLLLFALPLTILVSCNGREKELEAQNAELALIGDQKNIEISAFLSAMNSIQDNLDSIKQKENIITAMAIEDVENPSAREGMIVEDILLIYDKMQENKRMLDRLDKELEGSSIYNAELARTIKSLKKRIKLKDGEIAKLKDELARADIVIDNMMADLDQLAMENTKKLEVIRQKEEILEEKEAEIQKGYYIVGTSKELTEKNIIKKQGGFLGMGRIPIISEDASLEHFTQVNILKDMAFPIESKKATLVSSHPSHTFEFFGDESIDSLVVDDPDAFWQHTKVMVILVK
ncbi:MAG: hypothetical protein ACI85F_001234 [Bacteroidia bacterium]|jgi:hypothetical protein